MEEFEAVLDFTKRKPVKCIHCKTERGQHRAQTFQCPTKWSRGRVGYTHFLETVFTPPLTKEPASVTISGIDLPEKPPGVHF